MFSVVTGAFLAISPASHGKETPLSLVREGDVVFSSSELGQGEAIIAATGSPYTHCGVVFNKDGKLMVLEAVEPVGIVSLKEFRKRSKPGTFLAKRLKVSVTPDAYRKAKAWGLAQVGKNYDARFQWGDDRMYCSELVWKVFDQAGVKLCKPRKFKDYDLHKPSVKAIIDERYGGMERLPLQEKVVAPSDIEESELLFDVSGKS